MIAISSFAKASEDEQNPAYRLAVFKCHDLWSWYFFYLNTNKCLCDCFSIHALLFYHSFMQKTKQLKEQIKEPERNPIQQSQFLIRHQIKIQFCKSWQKKRWLHLNKEIIPRWQKWFILKKGYDFLLTVILIHCWIKVISADWIRKQGTLPKQG